MIPERLQMILVFAGWFVLMRWVLPAIGIPTCMSGACGLPRPEPRKEKNSESAPKHV